MTGVDLRKDASFIRSCWFLHRSNPHLISPLSCSGFGFFVILTTNYIVVNHVILVSFSFLARIAHFVIFQSLVTMAFLCLYITMTSEPGVVYTTDDFDKLIKKEKIEGEARVCNKCKNYKPVRAHHCSTCNTCILKMDHHW